ncbi:carboxypeptidase-like regulatory domain-containing protein, partial [Nocardioides sp. 616]|uniref:carboxypeptidase-like regulatory domain-containing protein n=1 Tax=Nocardioides sp. 616 TaxID=2268090 RepID=UPI001963AE3F
MDTRTPVRRTASILGAVAVVLGLLLPTWAVGAVAQEEPTTATLVGTISGPDGPIPGAEVSINGFGPRGYFTVRTVRADAAGNYRAEGLAAGNTPGGGYRLGFVAPGYIPEFNDGEVDLA